MKKLSYILLESIDGEITFGEEIQIEDKEAVILPVIINGVEMSTDEINFTITPEYLDNKICYRPDILIRPDLRGKGLGFKSPDGFRTNNVEIPKIYDKLSREPDIVVEKKPGGYYAYLKNQE